MVVKLADRIHNLRSLHKCEQSKQIKQVDETRAFYFQLCDIAETKVPKNIRKSITYARKELDKLCKAYEVS